MGYCEVQSVRAAPRPAPSRHSAEFATAGHDYGPTPLKAGSATTRCTPSPRTTPSSVPSPRRAPRITEGQFTCTDCLHSVPVYFVCIAGHSISLKPVESIVVRPVTLTHAACADRLSGVYRL